MRLVRGEWGASDFESDQKLRFKFAFVVVCLTELSKKAKNSKSEVDGAAS